LPKKPSEDELDQQIILTVEKAKPENVQQLIEQVEALSSRSRQEILDRIMHLEQEGKIHLKQPQNQTVHKFLNKSTGGLTLREKDRGTRRGSWSSQTPEGTCTHHLTREAFDSG
jgi:hypothetical protein